MQRSTKFFIILASIFTILTGVVCLILPFFYPVEVRFKPLIQVKYIPVCVPWILLATNFFFVFLSIWSGMLTWVSLYRWEMDREMLVWIMGGMIVYWFSALGYELLNPFPVKQFAWIFPLSALVAAVFYSTALCLYIRDKKINLFKKVSLPNIKIN